MTTRKIHKARGATFETDISDWFRAMDTMLSDLLEQVQG
jgi:hypothetical protein